MQYISKLKFIILFTMSFIILINSSAYASNISSDTLITSMPISNIQPRVALVLGGGGARGAAHLGVISVLEKAGVPIDLIVGTSIGSLIGAMYADNPHAEVVSQILLNTPSKQLLHVSIFHLYDGPISSMGIENFVANQLHAKQFNDLKIKFIAAATDLNSGETVPLYSGPINTAVAASMALPPFFAPLDRNDHVLVDGGYSDPVPVDIAKQFHPQIIIAVSIAEDVPPYVSSSSGMTNYKRAELIRRAAYDKMSTSDADVFIHPDVGQTGVFDNSHDYLLAQNGITAAEQALPQICALLKAKHIKSNCAAMLK